MNKDQLISTFTLQIQELEREIRDKDKDTHVSHNLLHHWLINLLNRLLGLVKRDVVLEVCKLSHSNS